MKNNRIINKKLIEEIENISLDEGYEVRIEIGGIIISIKTNDYELNRVMKEKFHAFLSLHSPELFIEIQVKDKSQTYIEKSRHIIIDDSKIFFNRDFYYGLVNLNEKISKVIILPSMKDKSEGIKGIIRRGLSYWLIDFEGVFLHAASIITPPDRGFIFCGESGCGKTTICNLSDKYIILNDDVSLVRKINNEYRVYSAPFYGSRVNNYVCAKIESLIFPRKSDKVFLKEMGVYRSLQEIMNNIFFLFQEVNFSFRNNLFNLCVDIAEKIPSYELYFLPDKSFWESILSITGKRKK